MLIFLSLCETVFLGISGVFWWMSSQVKLPELIVLGGATATMLAKAQEENSELEINGTGLSDVLRIFGHVYSDLKRYFLGKKEYRLKNDLDSYVYLTGRFNQNAAFCACFAIVIHVFQGIYSILF